MNINRRAFMKTALFATAGSMMPAWAAHLCFGQSKTPLREFRPSNLAILSSATWNPVFCKF